MITDQQKVDLQMLWLNGWPVFAAANHLAIPQALARRLIEKVKAQMVRDGKPWPRVRPLAKRPVFGKALLPSAAIPIPMAETRSCPATLSPPPATPAAPPVSSAPPPATPKPVPRPRTPTFEEQLARIAAGARLIPTFKPVRTDHPFTLGGVGSSLL